MRALVGLADRAVLRVAGEGAGRFLQGLCTQDVAALTSGPAASGGAAAAAFLSPRGRVLCDAILLARGPNELMIDVHGGVAKSLMRLLVRHRLREPLTIEDISGTHKVMACVPREGLVDSSAATIDEPPSDFFVDPRFAALGHRAVLTKDESEAVLASTAAAPADLSAYHRWRACCAVPEGPGDMPADTMVPLHVNLDLLNFISFTKGCYTGQELTTRTKHRGAVRRRVFSAVATADGNPQGFLDGLGLAPQLPLPASATFGAAAEAALPGLDVRSAGAEPPAEDARAVQARRAGEEQAKSCGTLLSTAGNVGMVLLRCDGTFNKAENFKDQLALSPETELTSVCGTAIGIRAPPYAFSE